MTFFVRRYQKGIKNSGTQDILTSEDEISLTDFVGLAHQTGPGKYLLGERGRGIRGGGHQFTVCSVGERY